MTIAYAILGFLAIGAVAWFFTRGLWSLLKLLGRLTGLGRDVDQYFDVGDGGFDASDRVKFYEQRPPTGGH